MAERLQKLLSAAGLGSRRKLEAEIADGALVVNGKVASLGDKADVGDRIRYADRRYRVMPVERSDFRLIAYNKPEGRVTTRSDEQGRPTVFEQLPKLKGSRWVTIGRLDINTCGLLMFTDNGDLAHGLMHPSSGVEREYACRVRGPVADEHVKQLMDGVELDDGPARFQRCWYDGGSDNNQWFRVVLSEGRNREVRRMWTALGYQLSRLIRVRYGPVELPSSLRAGKFADVEDDVVRQLQTLAGTKSSGASLTLVADVGRRPNTAKGRKQPTRLGRR